MWNTRVAAASCCPTRAMLAAQDLLQKYSRLYSQTQAKMGDSVRAMDSAKVNRICKTRTYGNCSRPSLLASSLGLAVGEPCWQLLSFSDSPCVAQFSGD